MYINHPDSDKGNLIITYATLDVMLNVPLVNATLFTEIS